MQVNYTGKLVLFTSFYEFRAYSPYVQSLVSTVSLLSQLGIKHDYWPQHGEFHIDRAVNHTLTRAMNDPEVTDIMLIDADESWEAGGLLRLLAHPEEIVGGAYRMKNRYDQYVGAIRRGADGYPQGRILPDGSALLEADRVAGGFMRIKTSALKKFHEAYPERRTQTETGIDTIFFQRELIDDTQYCHDFAFCRRWKDIGGELWIDPMVKIDHWGMTRYEGNYDQYLRDFGKTKAAFDTVAKMAANVEK